MAACHRQGDVDEAQYTTLIVASRDIRPDQGARIWSDTQYRPWYQYQLASNANAPRTHISLTAAMRPHTKHKYPIEER